MLSATHTPCNHCRRVTVDKQVCSGERPDVQGVLVLCVRWSPPTPQQAHSGSICWRLVKAALPLSQRIEGHTDD